MNLTNTIISNTKDKIDGLETTYSSQHEVQYGKVITRTLLGISSGMIHDMVWELIQWGFNVLATLGASASAFFEARHMKPRQNLCKLDPCFWNHS